MEKNINNEETRLFDLIESTNYSDLSSTDRLFVELHITEEDYNLQRRIMSDSTDLFTNEIDPIPLVIPLTKKNRTIPLYQALLAIAALFILFVSIWPNPTESSQNSIASTTKTEIKKEYIHDTIIQYVNQVKIVEKIVYDTVVELVADTKINNQEPKLLNVAQTLSLPELNKEMIATKGTSLKNDNSTRFILPLTNFR